MTALEQLYTQSNVYSIFQVEILSGIYTYMFKNNKRLKQNQHTSLNFETVPLSNLPPYIHTQKLRDHLNISSHTTSRGAGVGYKAWQLFISDTDLGINLLKNVEGTVEFAM